MRYSPLRGSPLCGFHCIKTLASIFQTTRNKQSELIYKVSWPEKTESADAVVSLQDLLLLGGEELKMHCPVCSSDPEATEMHLEQNAFLKLPRTLILYLPR